MADLSLIADLRKRYIDLTKQFFQEIDSGKSLDDLHDLQHEIEQLMMQMDALEKPGGDQGSSSPKL
jgi:hypothetical protein